MQNDVTQLLSHQLLSAAEFAVGAWDCLLMPIKVQTKKKKGDVCSVIEQTCLDPSIKHVEFTEQTNGVRFM